jgi:hypothetical protein
MGWTRQNPITVGGVPIVQPSTRHYTRKPCCTVVTKEDQEHHLTRDTFPLVIARIIMKSAKRSLTRVKIRNIEQKSTKIL